MSIKVLCIGDPHFKINNSIESEAMTKAILKVIEDQKPDIIVNLGDTLDRHESIHVVPLCRSIDFLATLQTIAPLYVLIGNHDMRNNKDWLSGIHPFTALKYWNNTTVVEKPIRVNHGNFTFTFCPYVDKGLLKAALNTIDPIKPTWKLSDAIFVHQEMRGSLTSENGDVWDPNYPLLISGHIHTYMELQPNVIYPGTPMQHDFGDNEDKAISIFTFSQDENQGDRQIDGKQILQGSVYKGTVSHKHERIPLYLTPWRTVTIHCNEVSTYEPPTGVKLRIVLQGITSELNAADKHPKVIGWRRAGIKIGRDTLTPQLPMATGSPSLATMPFSQHLFNAISNEQPLVSIFRELGQ